MAKIKIVNNSDTKLIFSSFNKNDDFAPFDHKWVDANDKGELDAGGFSCLGIGVQAQSGGAWIGGDPKDEPFISAGGTFTFGITKHVSEKCE